MILLPVYIQQILKPQYQISYFKHTEDYVVYFFHYFYNK